MAVAQQLPGIAHQRPRHLQDQVHRPVLGRLQLAEMIADAEEHVVAEQAAASRQPLQRSRWLRVDVAADVADFLEHAFQPRARDLVVALDDRCRSIQRRQPDAIGRDRIVGPAAGRPVAHGAAGQRRDGLVVGGIDRQKQRVRRRQRAQLVGMPSGQRAIAGETAHQLVPGFERRRGQLRLEEPPEHARVVLDEIDGGQQRRPVEIATEPQLQVVRFGELVEIDRPVQAPGRSGDRAARRRRSPDGSVRRRCTRSDTRFASRPSCFAASMPSSASASSRAAAPVNRSRARSMIAAHAVGLADAVGLAGSVNSARTLASTPRARAACASGRFVGDDGEQALDTGPARGDLVGDSAIARPRSARLRQLARRRAHHAQRPRQRRIRHDWNSVGRPPDDRLARPRLSALRRSPSPPRRGRSSTTARASSCGFLTTISRARQMTSLLSHCR